MSTARPSPTFEEMENEAKALLQSTVRENAARREATRDYGSTSSPINVSPLESETSFGKQGARALREALRGAIDGLKKALTYAKQHPFYTVAILAAAIPTLINAGLAALGTSAEELSSDTIEETSTETRLWALTLMLSSFLVNVPFAALFIPKAWEKLKDRKTWKEHPFIATFSVLIGGAFSAFCFAVIAYETMIFSPAIAVGMALASLPVNFAARFFSTYNLINRLFNKFFNKDAAMQEEHIDDLEKIHKRFHEEINLFLSEQLRNINETAAEEASTASASAQPDPGPILEELLMRLQIKLEELESIHGSLMDESKCSTHYLRQKAHLIYNLMAMVIVAIYAYITFTAKGFTGLDIISKWVLGEDSTLFDDFNDLTQAALGSLFSVGSLGLYLSSLIDLPHNLYHAGVEVAKDLRKLPGAILLLLGCGLSGSSMFNVSKSIASNPNGTFSKLFKMLQPINFGENYTRTGWALGSSVNASGCSARAYPPQFNTTNPGISAFSHYRDSTKYPWNKETASYIRNRKFPETRPAEEAPAERLDAILNHHSFR